MSIQESVEKEKYIGFFVVVKKLFFNWILLQTLHFTSITPVLANQFDGKKFYAKEKGHHTLLQLVFFRFSFYFACYNDCVCVLDEFNFFSVAGWPTKNTKKNHPLDKWPKNELRPTVRPTNRTFLESILYYSTWNLYPHLLDPFLFLVCFLLLLLFLVEKAKRPLATSILFITFLFISSALVRTLSSIWRWAFERFFVSLWERISVRFFHSFIHSLTHLILVMLLNLIFKSYWLEYLKCGPVKETVLWLD